MSEAEFAATGRCLCEAVRFGLVGPLPPVGFWVGSKPGWCHIGDDAPQLAEGPPRRSG